MKNLTSSFTVPLMAEKHVNCCQKHDNIEDKKSFFVLVGHEFLVRKKMKRSKVFIIETNTDICLYCKITLLRKIL